MRKKPSSAVAALLSTLFVLGAWQPPTTTAAEPSLDRALERARAHVARELRVNAAKVVTLGRASSVVRAGDRAFATAVFADPSLGRQRFIAVDLATGEILDADAFAAATMAAAEKADRFTPAARSELAAAGGAPVLLAFALRPVDYGPAVAAYRKAHADVTWDDDRPVSSNGDLVERRRLGLLEAKVATLGDHRAAFLRAARAEGAEVVATLDLVPMVYVRAKAGPAERLAARPEVGQVLQPDTYELAMSSAKATIDADVVDGSGLDGSGVRLGIIEYSYVRWAHTGLTNVPHQTIRVSGGGTGCVTGRASNADSYAT